MRADGLARLATACFAALVFAQPALAGEVYGGVYVHSVDTPLSFQTNEGGADFQLGYRQDNWQVLGYVENVFDAQWFDGAYADGDVVPDTSPDYVPFLYVQHTFGPSRPRTIGLRASYSF